MIKRISGNIKELDAEIEKKNKETIQLQEELTKE